MSKENKSPSQREKYGIRIACGTALVLSVVSLCASLPRPDLSFDYLGLVTGIIALCTTLVIGYQIYNAIELKSRIKQMQNETENRIRRMRDEMESRMAAERESVRTDIRQAEIKAKAYANRFVKLISALTFGEIYSRGGDFVNASESYADAYITACETRSKGFIKIASDDLKWLMGDSNLHLYAKKRSELLRCAAQAEDGFFDILAQYFVARPLTDQPKDIPE